MHTPAHIRFWAGVGGVLLGWGCAHQPVRMRTESNRAALSLYMQGLMFEHTSRLDEALSAYRQAIEHDYNAPSLHVRLGATYIKMGQPEQALKHFNLALAMDPVHRDALRWVAMLQTSQGRIAEAIVAYERLLGQDPADRFVLSTLADLYVLDGQLDKAIGMYERLVQEYGSSHQVHFNLGVLYGRLGDLRQSIAEFSRALELMPDSVETRLALGLTYELSQQPAKAAAHYEDAIRLDPLNARLCLHAARAYASQQKFGEAIRWYHTALDLAPGELEAVAGLVRLLIAERQYEQAHELLGGQLRAAAQPSELYLLTGVLYQEVHAPVDALRAFERSVDASEDGSAQAEFYLGAQLEQLGRASDARPHLRRAIALDPNHADALNYLGYMDADAGQNLQEAKSLIERALALDPSNGAYLDSLGWAYFKLGRLETAQAYLEHAAKLLDTDPSVFDHLGQVYQARGEAESARGAWQKSLELDGNQEDIKRKLEALMSRNAKTPVDR